MVRFRVIHDRGEVEAIIPRGLVNRHVSSLMVQHFLQLVGRSISLHLNASSLVVSYPIVGLEYATTLREWSLIHLVSLRAEIRRRLIVSFFLLSIILPIIQVLLS